MGDNGITSQTTPQDELTPQERAGIIAWRLAMGEGVTTAKAMQLTGLKERGARQLLNKLARKLPIYYDDGIWVRLWNEN